MTTTSTVRSTNSTENPQVEYGANLASVAALLEIGDRLGILTPLEAADEATIEELARAADLPEDGVANYMEALTVYGIVVKSPQRPATFRVIPEYLEIRYHAGFVSWTMNANRPFIENAREFLVSPVKARSTYIRDGRQIAISSMWMGAKGFYSAALNTILDQDPRRVVDLGAGAARLLIDVLQNCPDATALALDIDEASCAEATRAAADAGVAGRLSVVQRSIQSIASDPSPVEGADVIHAAFVFHDMMPEDEHIADEVLCRCHESLNPGGFVAITDAVPYATGERERAFSAAMTYFHRHSMGRKLLTEAQWEEKLTNAGFSSVETIQHRLPSGRLYVARKH